MPDSELIEIKIAGHTIKIALDGEGNGEITSDLHMDEDNDEDETYNSAIDGLEALVLAQACAGLNVTSQKYAEALETAVDAIANNT